MGHTQFLVLNTEPLRFWPRTPLLRSLLWVSPPALPPAQQSSWLLLYTASHPPVPVLRFSKGYHTFYNEKTYPAHTGGEQIYSSLCSHYGFQSPSSVHNVRGQHTKEKGMTSHSYHLGSAISVTNVVIRTVQILLVPSTRAGSKSYFSSGH